MAGGGRGEGGEEARWSWGTCFVPNSNFLLHSVPKTKASRLLEVYSTLCWWPLAKPDLWTKTKLSKLICWPVNFLLNWRIVKKNPVSYYIHWCLLILSQNFWDHGVFSSGSAAAFISLCILPFSRLLIKDPEALGEIFRDNGLQGQARPGGLQGHTGGGWMRPSLPYPQVCVTLAIMEMWVTPLHKHQVSQWLPETWSKI